MAWHCRTIAVVTVAVCTAPRWSIAVRAVQPGLDSSCPFPLVMVLVGGREGGWEGDGGEECVWVGG